MEITVRKAEKRDIPKLTELLSEVLELHAKIRPDIFISGRTKYTDSELEEIIRDDKTPVFVAEINGEIAGYAFCIHKQFIGNNNMTDIKTLYIDDLCVDENIRGHHIGTALYEYVLDYAKSAGCYNVTLNVWADNTSAVKFYEKIGLKVQKIGMEKIL